MKNTFTISLILAIAYCHLAAQTPDASFGIPASFELFNGEDRLGVTGCNFEGRNDRVYSTLHLSDGKIVLAGYTSGQDGTDFALVRLLSNGQYDLDAGPQGQIRIDLGYANDSCLIAALCPDEKILMGGCTILPGQNGYVNLIVKVDTDGQPDLSFGNGGQVVLDWPSAYEMVTRIILFPDGRALVAGNAFYGASIHFPDSTAFFIARLMPDGQLDGTFGENGVLFQRFNPTCSISLLEDIGVDAEGRIIVTGGLYGSYPGEIDGIATCYLPAVPVCRYLPDGLLDLTFGEGGIVRLTNTSGWANALHIEESGKIVLAGVHARSPFEHYAFAARLMPDGAPDATFGENGFYETYIYNWLSSPPGFRGILKTSAGYYLSYWNELYSDPSPAGLVRLTENGELDTTFGTAQSSNGIGFRLNDWLHVPVNIEHISTTDSESIILTGTYRLSGHENMMIAKIKLGTVVAVEALSVQEMKVFPNPAQSGKLFLDCTGTAQTSSSTLQLYDLFGRVVFYQITTLIEGANEMELPDLPNGAYVLEITGTNFRQMAKIIIQ